MTEHHETGAGTDLHRDILTTLLPGFDGTEAPDWVLRRLDEGLGGVCLFGQNIADAGQLRELNTALRAANPLAVVAIDEEGGDVTRLFYDRGAPYPGNALLGRIDDTGLTERVARAVGDALVATGCTVAFAPDVDVNSNADNPVIGVRSFGADPGLAARHAAAWVRGLQSTGVAASAKHFPGHGDTATDSHLALPVVDVPLETLRERELVPFRAAIVAGARTIMTSHILLPRLDAEQPATLSPRIVHGLLRGELGFEGVIVTDALDMQGASGVHGIPEAAVRALAAGCDLLCIGSDNTDAQLDEIVAAIAAAVASGRLPAERVREAAARVRELGASAPPVPSASAAAGIEPTHTAEELARIAAAFEVTDAARARLAASGSIATVVRIDTVANIAVGVAPVGAVRGRGRARGVDLARPRPRRGGRRRRTARRARIAARAGARGGQGPAPASVRGRSRRGAACGARRRRDRGHGVAVRRPCRRRHRHVRRIAARGRGARRVHRRVDGARPGGGAVRLGIDIGGTKTAAVAIGADGELSDQVRMPTGFGAEEVVATALRTVARMTELAGVEASSFSSIGIGIPGTVDSDTGRVAHAVNLGLEGLDLGPRLADRLGVEVRIENDVKAAAVGAHHLLGVADGIRAHSMAYLNLGTGLAAGIVLDGRLLRGGHGVAGEIGHIPVDPAGAVCSCGQRGCLETLASGSAIARMWPTDGALPARELFDAADAGDAGAIVVRERFLTGVAAAVRLLVLTTDVDDVVIGGGLAALGDRLLAGVRRILSEWAEDSAFLASLDLASRVQVIPLGFPAAAVGAALVGEHQWQKS